MIFTNGCQQTWRLAKLRILATSGRTDLGVDESEDVSQDVTDVRQTQQHERNAEHGVGDTHQPTPHRLRRNVAVACG